MEKKAKVTKVTKLDKVDSYGNTSYIIEFENTDKGYYSTKDADQKKFIVGNVADYVIEEKTGAKGIYFKVSLPKVDQPFTGGGGFQKKAPDPKVQIISFSMSYVKDLIVAGKVPMADLEKEFNRMFNVMISKL